MTSRPASVAKRTLRLPPFGIRAVMARAFELERTGRDLLHLEVGQVRQNTPAHIIEAAHQAMLDGHTGYTPTLGILPLREAVADALRETRGFDVDPREEVLITPGAKHALFCAMEALTDPGDEVLVPNPGFAPTEFAVLSADATPVHYPLRAEVGFALDPDDVERLITPRTRVLLLNTPHNPTGWVAPRETLTRLAELAERHNLWIVSDEVYDRLLFDGNEHHSITSLAASGRSIVVQGLSKTWCMTGWRLGWAAGPRDALYAMKRIQEATTTCAVSFVQHAGVAALRGPQGFPGEIRDRLENNRDALIEALAPVPRVRAHKPAGGMFLLLDVRDLDMPAEDLCSLLLEEHGVVTVSAGSFGSCAEGFLRLSFVSDPEEMRAAAARIARCLEAL